MKDYTKEELALIEKGSQLIFHNSYQDTIPELMQANGGDWEDLMERFKRIGELATIAEQEKTDTE